ncbi:MAG: extracellular solute-binding protein [Bauldia sp.]|nr:extracellular solute-binding protein [Bauldia sp.]
MNEFIKAALDNRLHADISRRSFIRGGIGLASLTVIGAGHQARAAELGGPLNFFGWDGEHAANVAKQFLEDNNIQMQATFQVAADGALTRFNTGGRGTMDLLTPNKDFQRAMLDADIELFQALDLSRIPNAAGLFPAFKNASWLVKNGKTYGIPIIWGDEPCIYNPAKWDGVPAKYTDFADPKYEGEIVLLDDPFGNIWLFAKSIGVEDPSRLTAEQLDKAVAAMMTIKPNVVTLGASFADMVDVMVRGDASIGLAGWAYQTLIAKEKGVELKVGTPAVDGTYYWEDAYAIAVDAPNIDNAYAFINFMTSAESNAAIATELGSGCAVEAAYDLMDPGLTGIYPYDIVKQADGGILNTQLFFPPQEPDGDIVPASAWSEAWQAFKLS